MSKGGHRREMGQTPRNRGSTAFGRHIRKRPNVGALASGFVGNEFEVLPFPKFAPNKFDGKFRKGGVLGCAELDTQFRYGVSRLPCVKGAVSVAD